MFFRVSLVLAGMGAGFVARAQQPSAAPAVLLRDVRLIDGTGAPPREHVSLLLRDGRIAAIGGVEMVAPKGVAVRELTGKTVMPDLIDTHTHLSQTKEALTKDLKQRAYYGVSAALSMGTDETEAERLQVIGEADDLLDVAAGEGVLDDGENRCAAIGDFRHKAAFVEDRLDHGDALAKLNRRHDAPLLHCEGGGRGRRPCTGSRRRQQGASLRRDGARQL